MKTFLLPLTAVFAMVLSQTAFAADEKSEWATNYDEALAAAKSSGKPILADFTGSDWCGWCIKLQEETFSKEAFADYAKENLVLLELDYPNAKEQSDEVRKQNEELKNKFEVRGFPTLVLINGDGKEIARQVGYLPGGPDAMIAWIKKSTED